MIAFACMPIEKKYTGMQKTSMSYFGICISRYRQDLIILSEIKVYGVKGCSFILHGLPFQQCHLGLESLNPFEQLLHQSFEIPRKNFPVAFHMASIIPIFVCPGAGISTIT